MLLSKRNRAPSDSTRPWHQSRDRPAGFIVTAHIVGRGCWVKPYGDLTLSRPSRCLCPGHATFSLLHKKPFKTNRAEQRNGGTCVKRGGLPALQRKRCASYTWGRLPDALTAAPLHMLFPASECFSIFSNAAAHLCLGHRRCPTGEPALTAFCSSGAHRVETVNLHRGVGLWGQLGVIFVN